MDGFCLQCIVTDADREQVFDAVRSRLKPSGTYLVSSAMFGPARLREGCLVNSQTGIALQRLRQAPADRDGVRKIGTEWYRLNRRHLKPLALRGELESNGFRVLYQDSTYGGHLICEMS